MVNMLVKCEAKSNRVKGMAFHPTLPWVLSALHNGVIQLWDYQLGALLDKFEDHEGPVRGMCFHSNQPLFVSGGDDYKVKVWNYKLRRCLFTLVGHLDYIRTCVFHPEYPWILSASDDQTIRIWNWQSRQCIAVLTGHNHYVMSAQFHPKDDLVISASLDQTIRVWDVSGLKEKTVSTSNSRPSNSDLFGVNDAVVKFVLEGHDRGVNWAEFHPTQPLIVSASDDRTVRLWRMNDSKAWEIDSLRGHFNNVSAVTFHPKLDLIISDGEDKTIRIWDATKRQLLHTFKREHDRFWVICCHSNLIGAGHDSGMVVFKLDRERPLCGIAPGNVVHIVQNRMLAATTDGVSSSILGACRKQVSPMSTGYKSLVVNPFNSTEVNVLVTYDYDGGCYDLFVGPKNQASLIEPKKGLGASVAFIARNRFAVLQSHLSLSIYSLHNELSKKVELPEETVALFPGGLTNRVVLQTSADKLVLFDTTTKEVLGELTMESAVRQVIWSASSNFVAILLKHSVVLAHGADLKFIQAVQETIRVKSGVWDEHNAFVYATSSHLKYALPFPGESGLISTIPKPMYLLSVASGFVTFADRATNVVKAKIFTHEYLFKLALLRGDSNEVLNHLKTGRLLGSVTIGYLKKKGFPEVALHFVQDLQTRFNLSLEFGHLTEALEAAQKLNSRAVWSSLGLEAMKMGQIEIAEKAFIATHDVQALQFLYFLAGNQAKLGKLAHRATAVRDHQARFNLALLRADPVERAEVLNELGLGELAKKTLHCKMVPKPAIQVTHSNWPTTRSMDQIFAAQWVGLEAAATAAAAVPQVEENEVEVIESLEAVPLVDAKAWGDDELDLELEAVQLPVTVVGKKNEDLLAYGESVEKTWQRRSAADLVAAGEFAEALNLLTKRIAISNPKPLESVFLDVYLAAHAAVPGLPFTPSIVIPIGSDAGARVLYSPDFLQARLDEVLVHTGAGNPTEALAAARHVLAGLLLSVASSEEEETKLKSILAKSRGYAQAMLIETTRRNCDDKKRELELAGYLCCSREVETVHLLLIVGSAMNVAFRAKNFVLASHFAKRIITGAWGNDELVQSTTMRARKVVARSEQEGTDEITGLNFDPAWLTGNALTVCCGSLVPISDSVLCPYCQSTFGAEWSGKTCTICQLSTVGATAMGVQFRPI